jgi:tRNA synthetases class I (E and Q), catalytic domain
MGWTAPPDAERSEPGVPGPSLQSRNLAIFPRLRGTTSHFVTAFNAAPTSCLTLPQAKSLVNAAYYAGQHEGRLQVRVDDAGSPQSCSMAFENALLEDLETLGIVPDQVTHTSDHFVRCEQLAERLIMSGRAYMDISPTAAAAATAAAAPGFSSAELSCRGRPPSESLHLFRLLCVGHAEGQGYCLRARTGTATTAAFLPPGVVADAAAAAGAAVPTTSPRRELDPVLYVHGNGFPHYRYITRPKFNLWIQALTVVS